MPKAKTAKNCYVCESRDRIRMTFMLCNMCRRPFCSDDGSPDLDQCFACLDAAEETG